MGRHSTTTCPDFESTFILSCFSSAILAVPNIRLYCDIHRGVPFIVSGSILSCLSVLMNFKELWTKDVALTSWSFRVGVGSSSNKKNGFEFMTTLESTFKYPSLL